MEVRHESPSTFLMGPTRLSDDVAELLELTLRTEEGTKSLLGQLPCPLVLAVPHQLHYSSLIWGKSSNLPDNRANEGGLGRKVALAVAGLSNLFNGSGGVTRVESIAHVGFCGGHFARHRPQDPSTSYSWLPQKPTSVTALTTGTRPRPSQRPPSPATARATSRHAPRLSAPLSGRLLDLPLMSDE